MISRAHLLISREVEQFNQNQPWGMSLEPISENSAFEWCAKIHGFHDTQWADGIFRVYLKFDENYNIRPPKVMFHTIPFHPNIDMVTGRPCLPFLDDWSQWTQSYTLSSVLLAVQCLLSNPMPDNAVNSEAARMMRNAPTAYDEMVEDCVIASQRVEAGQPPNKTSATAFTLTVKPPKTTTVQKHVSMISFEEYHKQWVNLATSNPTLPSKEQMFTDFTDDTVSRGYTNLTSEDVSQRRKDMLKEHYALVFGRNHANSTRLDQRADKLASINLRKQLYLPEPGPMMTPDPPFMSPNLDAYDQADVPDHEVDELVAWTDSLNTEIDV